MENKIKQKKSNCLRVVLYGPESSGKTTLANELAKHYKTVLFQNLQETIYKKNGI